MGWEEIDFDKIVKGATTNSPDSDNNYYNLFDMFSRALDEKLNFITISADSARPELPEIEFFPGGEIRTGGTFVTNFRRLLSGYHNLWLSNTWYKPAAFLDPVNFADYEQTENDLEFAMGENAYDLLTNRNQKSMFELWSADLLVGLYELYKLLNIRGAGLIALRNSSIVLLNTPMYFYQEDLRVFNGGNGEGDDYAEALGEYNSNKTTSIGNVGRSGVITGLRTRTFVGAGTGSLSHGVNDYNVVSIKSLGLDDQAVNLDIVGTGVTIHSNKIVNQLADSSTIEVFNTDFPLSGIVEMAPKSIEITASRGSRYEYYIYASPSNLTFPPPIEPGFAEGRLEVDFSVRMHGGFLINVNTGEFAT